MSMQQPKSIAKNAATIFNKTLLLSAGAGFLAGMRSMMPTAFLSYYFSNTHQFYIPKPFRFLTSSKAPLITTALAAGEVIADKLPFTPNRINSGPLIGRTVSGAFAGAAIQKVKQENVVAGLIAGAAGAVASSYIFYYARTKGRKKIKAARLSAAFTEDALAIGLGVAIISAFKNA